MAIAVDRVRNLRAGSRKVRAQAALPLEGPRLEPSLPAATTNMIPAARSARIEAMNSSPRQPSPAVQAQELLIARGASSGLPSICRPPTRSAYLNPATSKKTSYGNHKERHTY